MRWTQESFVPVPAGALPGSAVLDMEYELGPALHLSPSYTTYRSTEGTVCVQDAVFPHAPKLFCLLSSFTRLSVFVQIYF